MANLKQTRAENVVLIVLFLCSLYAPLLDSAFDLDPTPGLQEFRALSQKPNWAIIRKSFVDFKDGYNNFINDNFGFRRWLIQARAIFLVYGLNITSNSSKVVFGKDECMFGTKDVIEPVIPLSDNEIAEWSSVLEENNTYLAKRGIKYLIVFVPSKGTIYPELLPDKYARYGKRSRLDQLISYLKENTNLHFADLRDALWSAKNDERIYYLGDGHWNYKGAFVGYREVVKRVKSYFPLVAAPMERGEFNISTSSFTPAYARLLGLSGLMTELEYVMLKKTPYRAKEVKVGIPSKSDASYDDSIWGKPLFVVETADRFLPKAVVFHNSFGVLFRKLLGEHFRRTVFAHFPNYTKKYGNASTLVNYESPDLVIHQLFELRLTKGKVHPEARLFE